MYVFSRLFLFQLNTECMRAKFFVLMRVVKFKCENVHITKLTTNKIYNNNNIIANEANKQIQNE